LVPGELVDSDEDAETVAYTLRSGKTWVDGDGDAA
jgi:ABC-type oligopeptide transport system substrate-binding subunit